jgi:hypothetical protein
MECGEISLARGHVREPGGSDRRGERPAAISGHAFNFYRRTTPQTATLRFLSPPGGTSSIPSWHT